jgi:hypothetical protein
LGRALPFLILLILLGARGNAIWLVVAAGLAVEHSALPHKEFRFLYPTIACLMPPLGIGAARVAAQAAANWTRPKASAATIRIAWLIAASCSVALARQPLFVERWTSGFAALRSFDALREDPSACGVGLLKGVPMIYMPGYVWLHRDVAMSDNIVDPRAVADQMSDLLSPRPRSDLPVGFVFEGCWEGAPIGRDAPAMICRYHRPGSCAAAP